MNNQPRDHSSGATGSGWSGLTIHIFIQNSPDLGQTYHTNGAGGGVRTQYQAVISPENSLFYSFSKSRGLR